MSEQTEQETKKFKFDSIAKQITPRRKEIYFKKYFGKKTCRLRMYHQNRTHSDYTVRAKDGYRVKINDLPYLIMASAASYNNSSRMMELIYYEPISLPINIWINDAKILDDKNIEITTGKNQTEKISAREYIDMKNVSLMIDPDYLDKMTNSDIAKMVIQGGEMPQIFKKIQLFIFLTLIVGIIACVLILYTSGALNNVTAIVG